MIATIAVVLAFQFLPKDRDLATKLLKAANKSGWKNAAYGHPILGAHHFSVDEWLMDGSHDVRFRIDELKLASDAGVVLDYLKKTDEKRTAFDEPLLKGTGLKIDVLDYSNKRLSSLKGYAISNMRIYGLVKHSVVLITAQPADTGGQITSGKADDKAYGDVIQLAKLLADELKKRK